MGVFVSFLTGSLLILFNIEGFLSIQQNITIINELREFKPLLFGDEKDYFISKKVASVQDASQVCKSIGPNYHLVTFENESEYQKILPYLRSFNFDRVWTSGVKENRSSGDSLYEWTQPSPGLPMDFVNFPSPSAIPSLMARMMHHNKTGDRMPRCKNGFLTPKCFPGGCDVYLDPCETSTPNCDITTQKPCTVQRPDCGATCNNCTTVQPICTISQEPCTVVTKPCETVAAPCKIETPECHTVRPNCTTIYPPCEVTTPRPCTTKPPCFGLQNGTNCEPEICFPGAIICPTPIITCPPEETVCAPPIITCPKPTIHCPEPEVDCPLPKVYCTKPSVTCEAPEINCPGIIVNCPAPSFQCPSPIINCPPPRVECEEPTPCDYPDPPELCPEFGKDVEDFNLDGKVTTAPDFLTTLPPRGSSPAECDDCEPTGCVAMRRETGFKWKVENCSQEFHFICEGKP